ncbi:MAG: type II toxin-antitoxin system VapC family toxin [Bryobacteraceae bacterium]|nr:type II toxin-antitoxin system VapC family toxin [Bryobacteraceae bacterium]
MVVDTSALIAILEAEEDASLYANAITEADAALVSTANVVEAALVMMRRRGRTAARKVQELLREAGLRLEPVTGQQAALAIEAYASYGKGQNRAGLNYGDCFAYALAKATGLPLLFKGSDFSRTDIQAAL